MTDGAAPSRRPGRPRDARADAAILAAAMDVLADTGPGGFTVDAVAARAGVGKATIYRRWSSRGSLMLETAHRMGLEVEDPDSGSLDCDLVVVLGSLNRKMHDTPAGRVLPAVMAEAAVNAEMRSVLSDFVADRRVTPRAIVLRGIERGELPAGTDPDLVLDVLVGALFYRALLAGSPLDERQLAEVVRIGIAGFGHAAAPGELGGAGTRR